MTSLAPGANAPLPPAPEYGLRLSTRSGAADLIVLCVRADGTADGDNGVALWSQPSCAAGAVTIDTASNTVRIQVGQLPADVQRLLIVAQADTVPDLSRTGALMAEVSAAGQPAVSLLIDSPPALPTVQVAEIYRHSSGFKVRCLGDGYADGLRRLLEVHGIDVTDDDAPPPAPPHPRHKPLRRPLPGRPRLRLLRQQLRPAHRSTWRSVVGST